MAGSKLQTEIKQTRPFRSREAEAALGLLRTADCVRRRAIEVIAPFNISLEQYNVLRILRGASADGLPTLDVADRMIEQSPAITRLLDKLEAKRLVRRKRCKEDRRRVLCYITDAGLALLSELDAPLEAVTETSMGSLSRRDLDTLIELLDRVREGD